MPADPEKKALAEKLVREEKARWKAEWLEGQRVKKCASCNIPRPIGPEARHSPGRS